MRTIVSLTSYGERLSKTLPATLDSIDRMHGLNPDAIIIYLSETDYSDIDKNLFIKHPNLTARVTDDIKSYKKYIALTEREFDDDIVFIADDDVFYKPDTYINLYKEYEKHPDRTDTVYATWCKAFDSRDELFVADRYHVPKDTMPNDCFVFSSGWGVLVPPHIMRLDYETIKNGFEYGNNGGQNYISDDKLMSAYCRANNIKCACIYSVQHQMTFKGDTPLQKARVGKSNLHAQLAMRYFNTSDRDKIILSIAPSRPNAEHINKLFTEQTLTPDRVIVTLKPDTKISDKLKSLQTKHPIEIQYDENPKTKRWNPDNTEPNDLIFVTDGDIQPDTVETMFTEYYRTKYGYILAKPMSFTKTKRYGHQPTPDTERNVVRSRHVKNIREITPEELLNTILRNKHHK